MAAEKTGLPKYTSAAGVAYAARVKAVEPYVRHGLPAGCKTLTFSDSPKRVNLIPEWVSANNPVPGGYFVVEDLQGNTICRFVPADTFTVQFSPA